MKRILIIGNNALKDGIREQYEKRNAKCIVRNEMRIDFATADNGGEVMGNGESHDIEGVDEFVILAPDTIEDKMRADGIALEALHAVASRMRNAKCVMRNGNDFATAENGGEIMGKREEVKGNGESRRLVHLLLRSEESLRLLRTREYEDDWHGLFELNAFTMEDVWAKRVVMGSTVARLCGCAVVRNGGLDYVPILFECDRIVHLVVLGTGLLTSALVENAALVAHYPNYTRDHRLRTRITVIDNDVDVWARGFIGSHRALMDNSFYREIDIANASCVLHRPMYEGLREDFVDVEWEFVRGGVHDVVVQDKLQGWARDVDQVLSVAVCHEDDGKNLSEVRLLADLLSPLVGEVGVPIYVKQCHETFADMFRQSPRMKNVRVVGMYDVGSEIFALQLLKMAKRIKYVYDYCYENNGEVSEGSKGSRGSEVFRITAPSYIDDEEADHHWLQEKKAIKRYSNICNAMTITSKMRSLGHVKVSEVSKVSEGSKGSRVSEVDTFYAMTQEEVELIAQVEHNRWCVEEMLLGFRPCTDEEQAEIEADIAKKSEYKNRLIHYDLRAYNDLRADDTGKNVNTYDLCLSASIPLIALKGSKQGFEGNG